MIIYSIYGKLLPVNSCMKMLNEIMKWFQTLIKNHQPNVSRETLPNDDKGVVMKEQITKNFTLSELTHSDTALKYGLSNIPSNAEYMNMKALCENVLQPLRNALNKPIKVNSCFRSSQVNAKVGGAKSSQHLLGMAADIEIMGMDNYDLACYIRDNFKFDQLILEFANGGGNNGWVHVSWNGSKNRNQCLTIDNRGTKLGLIK